MGYIDAARDPLERTEVSCRTPITAYYLADGADRVNNFYIKNFGQQYTNVLNTAKDAPRKLIDLQQQAQVMATAFFKNNAGHGPVSMAAVENKAAEILAPQVAAKSKLYFAPFFMGIGMFGVAVALFNRVWTSHRFKVEQEKERAQKNATQPTIPIMTPKATIYPLASAAGYMQQTPVWNTIQTYPTTAYYPSQHGFKSNF